MRVAGYPRKALHGGFFSAGGRCAGRFASTTAIRRQVPTGICAIKRVKLPEKAAYGHREPRPLAAVSRLRSYIYICAMWDRSQNPTADLAALPDRRAAERKLRTAAFSTAHEKRDHLLSHRYLTGFAPCKFINAGKAWPTVDLRSRPERVPQSETPPLGSEDAADRVRIQRRKNFRMASHSR